MEMGTEEEVRVQDKKWELYTFHQQPSSASDACIWLMLERGERVSVLDDSTKSVLAGGCGE